MRWIDVYFEKGGTMNPRATALIMSAAWAAMAHWPDQTVAQTAAMNTCSPDMICNTLDWRGIPVPPEIAAL